MVEYAYFSAARSNRTVWSRLQPMGTQPRSPSHRGPGRRVQKWACPSVGAGFTCAGIGSRSRRFAPSELQRLPPKACSAPSSRRARALAVSLRETAAALATLRVAGLRAFRFAPWSGHCTDRSRAGAQRYRPPDTRAGHWFPSHLPGRLDHLEDVVFRQLLVVRYRLQDIV